MIDSLVDFLFATMFLGGFIGLLYSHTIWFTLAYIRYLQICLHLPMMNVIVPAKVIEFMKKTLVVPKLDPFKSIWREGRQPEQFDWALQEKLKELMPDQTEELGYETHNALVNQISFAFFIILYACSCAFYYVVKAGLDIYKRHRKNT